MDAKALEGFEAGDNIRLILRDGEKDIDIGEINLGMSVRDAALRPCVQSFETRTGWLPVIPPKPAE